MFTVVMLASPVSFVTKSRRQGVWAGVTAGALLLAQAVEAGVAAAKQLGLKWQKMVSRAYHDSLFMAKVGPPSPGQPPPEPCVGMPAVRMQVVREGVTHSLCTRLSDMDGAKWASDASSYKLVSTAFILLTLTNVCRLHRRRCCSSPASRATRTGPMSMQHPRILSVACRCLRATPSLPYNCILHLEDVSLS